MVNSFLLTRNPRIIKDKAESRHFRLENDLISIFSSTRQTVIILQKYSINPNNFQGDLFKV